MTRSLRSLVLCAVLVGATTPASAGPFGDDLGKCLVNSTSADDKTMLVQWIFATMALHPDVQKFAAATQPQRDALNRQFGDLIVVLLTKRCVEETKIAVKNEGTSVIETSFSLLGQVAAKELFSNPVVARGLADFGKLVDADKLKPVLGPAQ